MLRGIRPIRTKTKKGKECKEKVKPLVQVKLQEGRNSSVKESENTGKDKKRRKQKNSSQDQDVSQAYQTPQALGKALGKVSSRVLPQSPRKRKAVVFKLAHASGFLRKKKCTRGNRGLPKETVNLVKVFFQLDSISRQAPGRKDFVTVRENNTKHHIQKRHLLWSLRECYSIFMKENPTTEIGFNKFCSLRPVNVLLSADMPRDVCQNAL